MTTMQQSIIIIPPVEEHKISDCFQNQKVLTWYRDGDMDNPNWIVQNHESHPGGEGQIFTFGRELQFREMVKKSLGQNFDADISDQELQKHLIASGRCLRPKQLELLVKDSFINQNLTFLQDGRTTLTPIDNGKGTVSFLYEYGFNGSCRRRVFVYRFTSVNRWPASYRLLLYDT